MLAFFVGIGGPVSYFEFPVSKFLTQWSRKSL
jgi:hypothetical protein